MKVKFPENIVEITPKEYYEIRYSVPKALKSELDMYIEEGVGADGIAQIDECTEEENDLDFVGSLYLAFNEDYPYNECYVIEVAEVLQTLSMGESCIESVGE